MLNLKLDHLKDCTQIIAYLAKVVQETFKSCPTLDMEVFTVLTVYDHFSIPFFLQIQGSFA